MDTKLIIDPNTQDVTRAKDVLDELQAVCRRHGYVLQHTPEAIVLGKVDRKGQARAIAFIRRITPDLYEAAEIDWTRRALPQ